jgi:hypothetical protein
LWWCPTTPCPCGSTWSCWPGERRGGQPHMIQIRSGGLTILVPNASWAQLVLGTKVAPW